MSLDSKLNQQHWHTQAPANTMIMGEHSVVYGHPAIACAVNQFITIKWQQRSDSALNIYSDLAQHHTQIEQITLHPKLKFVIAALQAFQGQLPFGLDITIQSDFSSTIGLGSSAAVLAAMLDGLNTICSSDYDHTRLFTMGHKIILDIQGRGSGTDLAASLTGGMIYFQPLSETNTQPTIEKLKTELELVLIYSGYKTPTAEVLKLVANTWQDKPKQLEMLYRSMAKVTRTAYQHLKQENLEDFYQQCKDYEKLMVQLGVSDATMDALIQALNGCLEINAAKISGSGLGDCVLGVGNLDQCSNSSQNILNQFQHIDIRIETTGAMTQLVKA